LAFNLIVFLVLGVFTFLYLNAIKPKMIEEATKNRTVVMIAHRLSTVLASDKIVVMHNGRIVGIGSHEELLKTNERYQQLYNLQFAEN